MSATLAFQIHYRVAGKVYSEFIVTTPAQLLANKRYVALAAVSLSAIEDCPVTGMVQQMSVGWG